MTSIFFYNLIKKNIVLIKEYFTYFSMNLQEKIENEILKMPSIKLK